MPKAAAGDNEAGCVARRARRRVAPEVGMREGVGEQRCRDGAPVEVIEFNERNLDPIEPG